MKHRQKRYLQRNSAGKRMIRPWSMVEIRASDDHVSKFVKGVRMKAFANGFPVKELRISSNHRGLKQICIDALGNVYCGDIDYMSADGPWSLKSLFA